LWIDQSMFCLEAKQRWPQIAAGLNIYRIRDM
jgi:hypothetical protein